MKRCPKCQSTYTDDSLSFCLTDGATLVETNVFDGQATLSNELQATLRDEGRATLRDDDNATLPYPTSPVVDPSLRRPNYQANAPQDLWNPARGWTPQAPQPVPSLRQRNLTLWILGGAAILLLGILITVIAISASRKSSDEGLRTENRSSDNVAVVNNANSNKQAPDTNANKNTNKPVTETDAPPTDPDLVLSQLTAIENEWNDANMKGNKAAIRRIVADEFRGVGANGSVENKEQMLAHTSPAPQIASLTLSDLKVSLAGNTAVVTGLNTAKSKTGQRVKFRFTDTFLWRDGRWQAISSQASQVK